MVLSHQSQAILSAMVLDIERKLKSTQVDFPLGKVIQNSLQIERPQVEEFVNELRAKVLFQENNES